ncbi:hypothetical protein [Halalkalibacterium halodurans]|nr:hypothetical protein [Halalkalibacterium halodurans]MDY7223992.1 hypothetical protein [Halalkalibacterium halodurans]MDY7243213.1 hypothetical protein [Halalkalibacterium halodurans]
MKTHEINKLIAMYVFDLDVQGVTSACLVFPNYEPGEIFVLSHSWVPEK